MISKLDVDRKYLLLVSGLMWSSIGVLLNSIAYHWVIQFTTNEMLVSLILGISMGFIIAKFGFSHIALKNINRISCLPSKVSLLSFQEPKSYILIGFMMSLGLFLRKSGYFPETILAPVYIGIGTALFVSGLSYYKNKNQPLIQ